MSGESPPHMLVSGESPPHMPILACAPALLFGCNMPIGCTRLACNTMACKLECSFQILCDYNRALTHVSCYVLCGFALLPAICFRVLVNAGNPAVSFCGSVRHLEVPRAALALNLA